MKETNEILHCINDNIRRLSDYATQTHSPDIVSSLDDIDQTLDRIGCIMESLYLELKEMNTHNRGCIPT